jgi:hypothetical protein
LFIFIPFFFILLFSSPFSYFFILLLLLFHKPKWSKTRKKAKAYLVWHAWLNDDATSNGSRCNDVIKKKRENVWRRKKKT